MNDFVARTLADHHGRPVRFGLERLAGDASDRRYYRARTEEGLPDAIVMELTTLDNIVRSEEVTLYHDTAGELPFLNIGRFLAGLGLPVPEIHAFDREAGLMVLADLGETLLYDAVQERGVGDAADLYRRAVDLLIALHARATESAPGAADCVAFRQRFEVPLLVWEFDHFLEYGIESKGIEIAAGDKETIRASFRDVAEEIAAAPAVFTHRDYHSRNLLVTGSGLGIIDFQDALLGPPTYDLASLLRDSYVQLPDALRDELVEQYRAGAAAAGVPGTEDAVAFRRLFDRTAMQRNLKAAGRFDYIDQVKHNPKFLADIPRTLAYVRNDLETYEELAGLREALARYCPALG